MAADVEAHTMDPAEAGTYWKWIAALLSAVMLAGAPGYIYLYLNVPTHGEFNQVQDRQSDVLQRLAVQEEINRIAARDRLELRRDIEKLLRARTKGG